jgi:dienelactone hydrolase
VRLQADVTRPETEAGGVVLFAHGSGSSRLSPRNRWVANYLVQQGLVTVLMDLLTDEEERRDQISREYRFDIPRLAERLVGATDWLRRDPELGVLPLGYFGASTGAAAALVAAAVRPQSVSAVVSRGGRPDLADTYLVDVRAPTLMIVGGLDDVVIELNRNAAQRMRAEVEIEIEIVPGATHLFEEPGTLDRVAELAGNWFVRYLKGAR